VCRTFVLAFPLLSSLRCPRPRGMNFSQAFPIDPLGESPADADDASEQLALQTTRHPFEAEPAAVERRLIRG